MKKNTSLLVAVSILAFLVIFIVQKQIQFNQITASVLGDSTGTSESAVVPTENSKLGIGVIPLQVIDGEPVSSFSFSGDPGSEIQGKIRLVNQNKEMDLIADTYAVGTNSNTSTPTPMSKKVPGPEASWIKIATNIPLKKGEYKDVPFTITIPGNARPGDHLLMIKTETIRPETTETATIGKTKTGASIKISSTVGVRVALKISGKELISIRIKDLTIAREKPYIFNIVMENNGNVTVKPNVKTTIESKFRAISDKDIPPPTNYEILPGGIANVATQWDYDKIGIYTLRFTVAYNGKQEVREVKVIIYPTATETAVAIAIIIVVICGITFYVRRRRQNAVGIVSATPSTPPVP